MFLYQSLHSLICSSISKDRIILFFLSLPPPPYFSFAQLHDSCKKVSLTGSTEHKCVDILPDAINVHANIKRYNILLHASGDIKLFDFSDCRYRCFNCFKVEHGRAVTDKLVFPERDKRKTGFVFFATVCTNVQGFILSCKYLN